VRSIFPRFTTLYRSTILTEPITRNSLIQLRKVCDHPYLLPGAEAEPFEIAEHIVQASSKLVVLDKLLASIIPQGEKVLIFSQFTMMLDILEDFMQLRGHKCEFLTANRYLSLVLDLTTAFSITLSPLPLYVAFSHSPLRFFQTVASMVRLLDLVGPSTSVYSNKPIHRIRSTSSQLEQEDSESISRRLRML